MCFAVGTGSTQTMPLCHGLNYAWGEHWTCILLHIPVITCCVVIIVVAIIHKTSSYYYFKMIASSQCYKQGTNLHVELLESLQIMPMIGHTY